MSPTLEDQERHLLVKVIDRWVSVTFRRDRRALYNVKIVHIRAGSNVLRWMILNSTDFNYKIPYSPEQRYILQDPSLI